jgi:hypothetical protein
VIRWKTGRPVVHHLGVGQGGRNDPQAFEGLRALLEEAMPFAVTAELHRRAEGERE